MHRTQYSKEKTCDQQKVQSWAEQCLRHFQSGHSGDRSDAIQQCLINIVESLEVCSEMGCVTDLVACVLRTYQQNTSEGHKAIIDDLLLKYYYYVNYVSNEDLDTYICMLTGMADVERINIQILVNMVHNYDKKSNSSVQTNQCLNDLAIQLAERADQQRLKQLVNLVIIMHQKHCLYQTCERTYSNIIIEQIAHPTMCFLDYFMNVYDERSYQVIVDNYLVGSTGIDAECVMLYLGEYLECQDEDEDNPIIDYTKMQLPRICSFVHSSLTAGSCGSGTLLAAMGLLRIMLRYHYLQASLVYNHFLMGEQFQQLVVSQISSLHPKTQLAALETACAQLAIHTELSEPEIRLIRTLVHTFSVDDMPPENKDVLIEFVIRVQEEYFCLDDSIKHMLSHFRITDPCVLEKLQALLDDYGPQDYLDD